MAKYQNFYADIMEFVVGLRKQIGFNVTISMILKNQTLTIGIHLKHIPAYAKLPPFEVQFEEADFSEPGDNLTKVILDQLTEYLSPYSKPN